MRKLDAADRGDQPEERQAAAARRAGPPVLRRRRQVRRAATRRRRRSGRRPCTRRRGRRWSTAASRTTTSASAATSPATARSAAAASGHTEELRDVQCEVCHGPGSTHVAEEGTEDPPAVHRQTPASTCTACHTEQHSDTFQYEAYLRDIVGAGPRRERAQEAGRRPDRARAARRAALARAKSRRGADEGYELDSVRAACTMTCSGSGCGSDADGGARRSAAGRAGRARCCRR